MRGKLLPVAMSREPEKAKGKRGWGVGETLRGSIYIYIYIYMYIQRNNKT